MFSIRVPLLADEAQQISKENIHMTRDSLRFCLNWDGKQHVLIVDGFETENEAKEYLDNLNTGMNWLLLHSNIPVKFNLDPQEIKYFEDPVKDSHRLYQFFGASDYPPIDGLFDGFQTAILDSDKKSNPSYFSAGNAYCITPSERVLETILEGIEFSNSNQLANDQKLVVALKLYREYHTESSATARFLTLMIALEALALPVPRPQETNGLLDKWRDELDGMIDLYNDNKVIQDDLKALRDEVLRRRDSSIGTQISNLVKTSLIGETDYLQQERTARRLYGVRSTLVHRGYVDPQLLDSSTSEAKSLVSRVLHARFLQAVSGSVG